MRIGAIIGVGPITVDAMVASVGNAREFRNGRQLAAWLGVVPTQRSSGGHTRLGTISCRGNAYLRTLLIQGARSSLQRARAACVEKSTPETSERLKAQGKNIKRAVLTGSLLRGVVRAHCHSQHAPDNSDCR